MTMKSGLMLCASAAMMLLLPASASRADTASAKTTMTTAQCENLFDQADTDHDGSLTMHEDPKWEEHILKMGTLQPKDTLIIHRDDFIAACKSGDFDNM